MLQVQNLIDKRISNPISFSVGIGEVVVLKGPNGSGKTTLLRLIAGVLDAPSSSVSINATHSYLGHALGLFSELKVKDYLTSPHDGFDSALRDKKIGQLSAGQKCQLALLLMRSKGGKLWIMDEPTAHLDTQAVSAFYEHLKEHCGNGGSVLFATHSNDVPDNCRVISLE